jgi:hypothetical protein
VLSEGWAEMIRKIYEIDPLLCPRCGGQIRITAFIKVPRPSIRPSAISSSASQPSGLLYLKSPAATPDGRRGEWGVFLRTSVAALTVFKIEFCSKVSPFPHQE